MLDSLAVPDSVENEARACVNKLVDGYPKEIDANRVRDIKHKCIIGLNNTHQQLFPRGTKFNDVIYRVIDFILGEEGYKPDNYGWYYLRAD